jgi:hypothetical protein
MVDHYADLAQETGMSLFYVGSEMIDSDGYLDSWHQVIASARQHFSGPLSYEEDWREIGRFGFGDAVDLVSISAYFPISNDPSPSLGQLDAGWHSYQGADAFSEVAGQAQRWGKPIVFGEVGYEASSYAGVNPCCNSSNTVTDPGLQARAYRALLDTFVGQPWWGGVTWWAWNNGNVRSPEGKAAEGLIGEGSVAFPSPPTAPQESIAKRAGSPPIGVASGGAADPLPAPAEAIVSTSTSAGGLGVAGAAQARDDRSSSAGPPGPDPHGSTPVASTGLVGLRISHEGVRAADHVTEALGAILALGMALAASVRLAARSWQRGRRPSGF